MTERIAYQKPDGGYVDADVARWVMAILEIAEQHMPGFRNAVLAWLEDALASPVSPSVLRELEIIARSEEASSPPGRKVV